MGYARLIKDRKSQTEYMDGNKCCAVGNQPKSDAPIYGVWYTFVVSGLTCILGTVFFAYKWFVCLNYLIGRKLFKPKALTIVWAVLMIVGVVATWIESFGLQLAVWLLHISVAVYLLYQLWRCRICTPSTKCRMVTALCLIGVLWIAEVVLLFWFGLTPMAYAFFVLVETALIQWMFNLAVYDMLNDNDLLEDKIARDGQRFGTIVLWIVVALSVLLFFFDVSAAVANVLDAKFGRYHCLEMDGWSLIRMFVEEYYPHAGWQCYLWILAALMAMFKCDLNTLLRFITRVFSKESLKGVFSALFPSVEKQ